MKVLLFLCGLRVQGVFKMVLMMSVSAIYLDIPLPDLSRSKTGGLKEVSTRMEIF